MLAALIASSAHAALAEALRGEYRQPTQAELAANPALKDHMVLDVSPVNGFGLDNVEQLKTVLGTEKARADKAEQTASKYKDIPADATNRLARLAELEKLDPNAEADKIANQKFEAAKGELLKKFEEDKGKLEGDVDFLFGHLDQAMRVQAATQAIIAEGGNPDVLLPHVLGNTKFDIVDDKPVVSVIDQSGNPRIGDSSGGPMTLTQLVAEYKAKDSFAPLFDASGRSGGGTNKGNTASSTPAGKKKSEMNLNERAAFISEHGQEAYLAMEA